MAEATAAGPEEPSSPSQDPNSKSRAVTVAPEGDEKGGEGGAGEKVVTPVEGEDDSPGAGATFVQCLYPHSKRGLSQ